MLAGVGRIVTADELREALQGVYYRNATAFSIGRNRALTAYHCVDNEDKENPFHGKTAWVLFAGSSRRGTDPFSVFAAPFTVERDLHPLDVAILRLSRGNQAFNWHRTSATETPVSYRQAQLALWRRHLLLRRAKSGQSVTIQGFPAQFLQEDPEPDQSPNGRIISGAVVSVAENIAGAPSLSIEVPAFRAVQPENPRGFSGGPIIKKDTRSAVGVVRGFRGGNRDLEAARGGILFATPTRDILRSAPGLFLASYLARVAVVALLAVSALSIAALAISGTLNQADLPPPPTKPSVTTQLPGCNRNLESVQVSPSSDVYRTSTTGPGTAVQLRPGESIEQPFASTTEHLASVEVWAANNNQPSDQLLYEIVDAKGKVIWTSLAIVDDSNTNNPVPAIEQPDDLPLRLGDPYVLRIQNRSADTVALFTHSPQKDDVINYAQAACILDGKNPGGRPAPSGQYLAARLLGRLPQR